MFDKRFIWNLKNRWKTCRFKNLVSFSHSNFDTERKYKNKIISSWNKIDGWWKMIRITLTTTVQVNLNTVCYMVEQFKFHRLASRIRTSVEVLKFFYTTPWICRKLDLIQFDSSEQNEFILSSLMYRQFGTWKQILFLHLVPGKKTWVHWFNPKIK